MEGNQLLIITLTIRHSARMSHAEVETWLSNWKSSGRLAAARPLVASLSLNIVRIVGQPATSVASPGVSEANQLAFTFGLPFLAYYAVDVVQAEPAVVASACEILRQHLYGTRPPGTTRAPARTSVAGTVPFNDCQAQHLAESLSLEQQCPICLPHRSIARLAVDQVPSLFKSFSCK